MEVVKNQPVHKLAIKAVTDDAVEIAGYGVIFGTTDLENQKFSPETNFWLKFMGGGSRPLLWDHSYDDGGPSLDPIGTVTSIKQDEFGLWFEATLDRANQYSDMIRRLIEMDAVGASTGSAPHMVRTVGQTISSWPIVELSLTPTPAEPMTVGGFDAKALKALGYKISAVTEVDEATEASDKVSEDDETSAETAAATATAESTESEVALALQLEHERLLLQGYSDGNSSQGEDRR